MHHRAPLGLHRGGLFSGVACHEGGHGTQIGGAQLVREVRGRIEVLHMWKHVRIALRDPVLQGRLVAHGVGVGGARPSQWRGRVLPIHALSEDACGELPLGEEADRRHKERHRHPVQLEEGHRRLGVRHEHYTRVARQLRELVPAARRVAAIRLLDRSHPQPRREGAHLSQQRTGDAVVGAREEEGLVRACRVPSGDIVGEGWQVKRPHARKVPHIRLVVSVVSGDDHSRRFRHCDDRSQPRSPSLRVLAR
mmetsp:Transcript_3200/g.7233  ORF Transcript_3200/g.7233 Transcript_3200/m.7233 type:complete len:251 (+) Transcript_3200:51-803(+)